MDSGDSKGVIFVLIAAIILAIGSLTVLGLINTTSPIYGYTNLSDNNTANLSISCAQNATRYFIINDSLSTLGDASVGDICYYTYQNVTMALYYDGIYKDNFTLNCSNSTPSIEILPIFQINVQNGVHNITYATNLCYDNPDTNTSIQLNVTGGRQFVTYVNSVTNENLFSSSNILLFEVIAILLALLILSIIVSKF